ncbi:MAG: hypothetical protein JKX74_07685 [Flavobacteriales bacterium]|nr:hypothetical protein [Flavobacteriales bacterium]
MMDQLPGTYESLGSVGSSDLIIDGESFGSVREAKHKFDTALGNLLD